MTERAGGINPGKRRQLFFQSRGGRPNFFSEFGAGAGNSPPYPRFIIEIRENITTQPNHKYISTKQKATKLLRLTRST